VLDLSAIEAEFLQIVRIHAARGRRRRIYVFVAIFSVIGLVLAGGSVAFIRIQQAEHVAKDKAAAAEKAQGELQGKLDVINEKERQRLEAEKLMLAAQDNDKRSREELVKANAELQNTLTVAQGAKDAAEKERELAKSEKVKAESAQAVAERERVKAQKSSEDLKAANQKIEANVKEQQKRINELQAQLQKIYNGSLH
jgi:hypothetical protein